MRLVVVGVLRILATQAEDNKQALASMVHQVVALEEKTLEAVNLAV